MTDRRWTIAAVVFVLAFGMLTGGSFSADAAKNTQWEYQLIGMRLQPRSEMVEGKKVLSAPSMESEFNYQGKDGWEFVNTIPGTDDAYFVVFRKQK